MTGPLVTRLRAALLLGLAGCLLPFAALSPSAEAAAPVDAAPAALAAETTQVQGSLNLGDVQQVGRLTRDGQTHGCEAPTAMPGVENVTPVRRDTHVLQNTHDTPRCIVVEADLTGCAGNQVQVVGYSSFNPAAPGNNVIGASGFSTIASMRFGFRVAPSSSYAIGINEVDADTGCPLYKIKVTNTPLAAVVTQADAANGFGLQAAVGAFRGALGAARQEITWEEVGEDLADPHSLPADYYNTVQPRGLVFTGPADVRVSSDGSGSTAAEFGDIDAGNPAKYQPFSFSRLMSPVDDEVAEIAFRLPGTSTPAPTSGFGAVFVNPGTAGYLLPRDAAGDPLGLYVPPERAGGLGLYGVQFATPQIYSMSLAGNWATGVVSTVFDNFLYADPGFRLGLTVTGQGRVTGPGLACPGDCAEAYGPGPVKLTAEPTGVTGIRWGGACAGTSGLTCVLTPAEAQTAVAATFVSCAKQKAKLGKLTKLVKKRKVAVRKATTRLAAVDGPADVAEARSDLTHARKALKKAKKKVRKAKRALVACLG